MEHLSQVLADNSNFRLSPSRANDFLQCPLMYRFRTIDKLPEPTSRAQIIGTSVHSACEHLFSLPRPQRTVEQAIAFAQQSWEELINHALNHKETVLDFSERAFSDVEEQITQLLNAYFALENPQNFDPFATEAFLQSQTGKALLRGYIDRIDKAPDGRVRIVDYKTGKSPQPQYQSKLEYQLKFYAGMYWIQYGVLPSVLRLIFLGNQKMLELVPEQSDIEKFLHKVETLWVTINELRFTGQFQPRKSPLCKWCAFQQYCPEFGGEVPPYTLDLSD